MFVFRATSFSFDFNNTDSKLKPVHDVDEKTNKIKKEIFLKLFV